MRLKRSLYCAQALQIGEVVTVSGWVAKRRDLGSLLFLDLRDRSGIIQLAFDDQTDKEVFDLAAGVRSEYVVSAKGIVRERESKNPDLPTGNVEVYVSDFEILAAADTPPFEITDDTNAKRELRLKYRYLDLRRPMMQRNIRMRHEIAKAARDFFDSEGFYEIETPTLIRSTPEGARDYIVPSRVHPGSFYALPQSPQLYKQLLMVAGIDKYVQLARCYRDEDLRADRQPEFTQIDMEMSFVDQEDLLNTGERFMKSLFSRVMGIDLPDFPRMTFADSMRLYGTDKPDIRFGMTICDVSEQVKNSAFPVFADTVQSGGMVGGLVAEGGFAKLSRKEIDKLTEFVRGIGARGLAWVRLGEEGTTASFAKFMAPEELQALCDQMGAKKGDVILFVADKKSKAQSVLGSLRLELAKKLEIKREGFAFLWITEMPFFEWDEESESWLAMHHPFTAPLPECVPYLHTDPGNVRATSYDMVVNGTELCSGSMRITDSKLQKEIFDSLGISDEEAHEKFGYLLDAYRFAAPPHGGFGLGLDRLAMIMTGSDSLQDVVAFPKVQNASELMTMCPAPVDEKQLEELALDIRVKEEE